MLLLFCHRSQCFYKLSVGVFQELLVRASACIVTYRRINRCCGVIIWAKFGLLRCYYLGQVCFLLQNTVCQKSTIQIGVSAHFVLTKNSVRNFELLLSGPSWAFLSCSELGPDNNTYLAQITPFLAYKNVLKYLFL